MRRYQFQEEWMTIRGEKGDVDIEVYSPQPLLEFVNQLRIEGQHLLPKNLAELFNYNAVEKPFSAWRHSLGPKTKEYSLHGLRKIAIVKLAEADETDAQIQAITGRARRCLLSIEQKKIGNRSRNLLKNSENSTRTEPDLGSGIFPAAANKQLLTLFL